MASIMKRGDSYSVRYKYKDHSGKPCEGWESFKTKKEAQERKITVEKELLDGTISVSKTMQRANKDALEKLDPNQVYHTFPDRREGSKSSLILKKPKTKKSNRVLYMTKPLKEELQAWLEKLKQDEQSTPEKYSNCGQLFRLPDGLPIAPELLTKNGITCGEPNTRSLSRSCSTVCGTPVPPTSSCSRMVTSSRCRAIRVTPPHLS